MKNIINKVDKISQTNQAKQTLNLWRSINSKKTKYEKNTKF